MIRLTSILLALVLALGCRDKTKSGAGSASGSGAQAGSAGSAGSGAGAATSAPSAASIAVLPEVADATAQVSLDGTAGLVAIKADGTILVSNAPVGDPLASGKPAKVGAIATALGLPAVAKRPESALGTVEAAGSGADMNPTDVAFARLGHPAPTMAAPASPTRLTSAFALTHPHDVSAGVVVFADAKAPAATLVDVLAETGGFVAVRKGTQLSALSIAADRQAPPLVAPTRGWIEVRLGAKLEIEAVPGAPTAVASIDKLGESVTALGAKAVDVLVAPETTVGDLVAALTQLRAAKLDAIGLGRTATAGSPQAAGHNVEPRVLAWNFYMQDMDKTDATPFREAMAATVAPMHKCYAAEVAKKADLAGEGQVEVILMPDGKVTAAAAELPPALAACATKAAQAATWPKVGGVGTKLLARVAFVAK